MEKYIVGHVDSVCWVSVCLRSRAKVSPFDNNMATGTKPASSKTISRSALQHWLQELLENYEFEYDDPNEKAIKATCIVCNKHYKKFQAQFKGKVVQDVVNYGENGTTYLLKPNLERPS